MALDQRRRGRAVVAKADQAAQHLIAGGQLRQFRQGLRLRAGRRKADSGLFSRQQDVGRNHLGRQLIEGIQTQVRQHPLLIFGTRTQMPDQEGGGHRLSKWTWRDPKEIHSPERVPVTPSLPAQDDCSLAP